MPDKETWQAIAMAVGVVVVAVGLLWLFNELFEAVARTARKWCKPRGEDFVSLVSTLEQIRDAKVFLPEDSTTHLLIQQVGKKPGHGDCVIAFYPTQEEALDGYQALRGYSQLPVYLARITVLLPSKYCE